MLIEDIIHEALEEIGFTPTDRRVYDVYYSLMWDLMGRYKNIDKKMVDKCIRNLYNIKIVRDTKLARKMYSNHEILHIANGNLIIREYK